MRTIARIYGHLKPVAPDILIAFDIKEFMQYGHWQYKMENVTVQYQDELIDELNADNVTEQLKNFIETMINSPAGQKWVSKPDIHFVYDDELKNIRIMETPMLFKH